MNKGNTFWMFAAAATAALTTGFSSAAVAQSTAAEAGDEIVITATRREARLQDVPVAVTPVTAELIQNSGIRDLQDLTSVAPALQFNVSENETSATARLRGIGTQGSNPGLESAVGIFIDGVYRARNGVALTDLGEISQVEVLRGPQGTLFGRNTSAGLISVVTAAPSLTDFEADIEATYGDYNETRLAGSVGGPLIEDVLAARLFAARATRDGFMDVINAQGARSESNNRDVWTMRGQLLWEPNPDVRARFIVDYSERDEVCCAAKIYSPELLSGNVFLSSPNFAAGSSTQVGSRTAVPFATGRATAVAALGGYGPGGISALGSGDIGDRFGFANRSYDQKLEDQGVSGEINWDVGGATLTSVTAWRDWSFTQGQDADFSAADILWRPGDGSNGFGFEVFTQEFRLAGQAGALDWLVGAFYSDETLTRRDAFRTGTQYAAYLSSLPSVGALYGLLAGNAALGIASANDVSTRDRYEQEGTSLAFFTHNIIALSDKLDVTLGLRYTQEEKSLTARYNTAVSALPAFRATLQGLASNPALAGALAAQGLTPTTFATTFANCNPSSVPTGTLAALASAVVGGRAGYCVPWLRNDLDARGVDSTREENEWSGVASVRYEFTPTVSAYASYSRGYKSGGFNLDRDFDGDPSFNGEFVDAYELGVKSALFDGDLLLNLALFSNEFENFQLNTFNGIQFVVTSVPEVTSEGVELDAIWRTPIEGLSYQGGVSYTDAKYGPDTGWVFANRNPITGEATLINLPNSRLTNAPEWSTTHAFTFEQNLTDNLRGIAYVDLRWVSEQNTGSDLRASKVQPSYTLVNGRLSVTNADERYSLELWGRNLFNEEYAQIMFDAPLQTGGPPAVGGTQGAFLGDPRTFGVTVRARY